MSEQDAEPDQQDVKDVEAIRNILFGRTMRQYEDRLAELQTQLEQHFSELREKQSEQLQLAETEFSALSRELQQTRTEVVDDLKSQLDALRQATVERGDLATILRAAADRLENGQ